MSQERDVREGDVEDVAELAAERDLLREENARLRREYVRARQSRYRRTAAAMIAVALVAVAGGLAFPDSREVLFALAGTGAFAGVLTYYLTPERFVSASVGERVYAAMAENGSALVADLGLADERVYVPVEGARTVRLFVPQRADYEVPPADDLSTSFVVTGRDRSRGLALEPTGETLFAAFERSLVGDLADDPPAVADQLVDGLVEDFELVESATVDADSDGGRLTVGISESAYGGVDRFDHPVASFLAVGLARGLGRPVRLEVDAGDDRADALVTCRWES